MFTDIFKYTSKTLYTKEFLMFNGKITAISVYIKYFLSDSMR